MTDLWGRALAQIWGAKQLPDPVRIPRPGRQSAAAPATSGRRVVKSMDELGTWLARH